MLSVLVSHPHAATVANHVASGLERHGWLAQYVTGIAAADRSRAEWLLQRVGLSRKAALNRIVAGVPAARLRALWAVEATARGVAILAERASATWRAYDALFVAHDAAVAHLPLPRGLDAVYAYEDGALATFRRADRHGLARIWDLPLPHWRTLEEMWLEEAARWPEAMGARPHLEPEWKKRRKDAELELADIVVAASRFTRRSLEKANCQKVVLELPYGFPVEEFAAKARPPDGSLSVLAVGTHDLRKGTPYLLEAWRQAGLRDARLRLVGPMRLTGTFLTRYEGLFEHVPHLARADLELEYQAADLLAFPTLGDGFGLVMQEAMCCGTPVLTTPCGGGPECVTDGVDGWLVPARDVDGLVERLREAASDRERLFRMGMAARAKAERYAWPAAEERLAQAIGDAIKARSGGARRTLRSSGTEEGIDDGGPRQKPVV